MTKVIYIPHVNGLITLWPNMRVVKWGARQRCATRRSSSAPSGQVHRRDWHTQSYVAIHRITIHSFIHLFVKSSGFWPYIPLCQFSLFLCNTGGFPHFFRYRGFINFFSSTARGLSDSSLELRGRFDLLPHLDQPWWCACASTRLLERVCFNALRITAARPILCCTKTK